MRTEFKLQRCVLTRAAHSIRDDRVGVTPRLQHSSKVLCFLLVHYSPLACPHLLTMFLASSLDRVEDGVLLDSQVEIVEWGISRFDLEKCD